MIESKNLGSTHLRKQCLALVGFYTRRLAQTFAHTLFSNTQQYDVRVDVAVHVVDAMVEFVASKIFKYLNQRNRIQCSSLLHAVHNGAS